MVFTSVASDSLERVSALLKVQQNWFFTKNFEILFCARNFWKNFVYNSTLEKSENTENWRLCKHDFSNILLKNPHDLYIKSTFKNLIFPLIGLDFKKSKKKFLDLTHIFLSLGNYALK